MRSHRNSRKEGGRGESRRIDKARNRHLPKSTNCNHYVESLSEENEWDEKKSDIVFAWRTLIFIPSVKSFLQPALYLQPSRAYKKDRFRTDLSRNENDIRRACDMEKTNRRFWRTWMPARTKTNNYQSWLRYSETQFARLFYQRSFSRPTDQEMQTEISSRACCSNNLRLPSEGLHHKPAKHENTSTSWDSPPTLVPEHLAPTNPKVNSISV